MKKIQFKIHVLPHLMAVIVFLVVSVLFFNPVFFGNRTLDQQDINQWKGGAQEGIQYRKDTGKELLWTNSMFGGMPAYLVDVQWNDGVLTAVKEIMAIGLPHPVRNMFLAFLSFYILLLAFRVRPWLAIAGGLAFGLSSYIIIGFAAGHNARIGAVAFMPLVLAGIHVCLKRDKWVGLGLTALAVALELRENHLQITYYLLMIIIIYGLISLIEAFQEKNVKPFLLRSGLLVVAALLALATFYGKFSAITEYSHYSMRGVSELSADKVGGENVSGLKKSYAFKYSYGLAEPMTLFIPDLYGGSSSHLLVMDEDSEVRSALQRQGDQKTANQLARYSIAYWGPMALPAAPYYCGAVVVFLFVLGIVFGERKLVIWLVAVAGLGILLAMGDSLKAFNYLMFDYFPGYNKFRSVPFAIIMTLLAMPLLGFIGLEKMLNEGNTRIIRKKLFLVTGITAGLAFLYVLLAGLADFVRPGEEQMPDFFLNALTSDRESLLRSDAFRSLIFVLITALFSYLTLIRKISPLILGGLLVVLVLADEWSVDNRYFGEDNYRRKSGNEFFTMTPADKEILKDKAPGYRVYNLQDPMNEARTSYYHSSIGGYHGAKLRRYQDLFEYCLAPETQELVTNFKKGETSFSNYGVINMLNTRYLVFGPEKNNIINNPQALGNAWFVQNVIPVKNADDEISETCQVDPISAAVIDINHFPLNKTDYSSDGSIKVVSYTPADITYSSDNSGEGLAVFSEIYYPKGWDITIDGKSAEMIRVNYVLRGLVIPPGKHEIRFVFAPTVFTVGNTVMLISSILLVLLVIGCFYLGIKQNDPPETIPLN